MFKAHKQASKQASKQAIHNLPTFSSATCVCGETKYLKTSAAAALSRGWDVLDDEAADDAYWAGVRDLTIMHLVELWALGLFGAGRLDDELSRLAEHVAESMARGGEDDWAP